MPENNTTHFTRKMALYGYMFQKYKQRDKRGIKKISKLQISPILKHSYFSKMGFFFQVSFWYLLVLMIILITKSAESYVR